MHEHTLDTLLSTNLISETAILPLPTFSVTGSDSSGTYVVASSEPAATGWPISPQAGGLIVAGKADVQQNYPTHSLSDNVHGVMAHVSALGWTMSGLAVGPFAVPARTCGLSGGLHCGLPSDGSLTAIKLHLHTHGHRHARRQAVQCPWMGCTDTLKWMNVPRHIQSIHLGVRFACFNCGKLYTRPEGLARHTIALKCYGQCSA